MLTTQVPGLYILKDVKKGRKVCTTNGLSPGDLIEICPVILLKKKERKIIHNTTLHDYYFLWGKKRNKPAIALGFGSLYNHSDQPNAAFELDLENVEIRISCIKEIASGDEITISYTDEGFKDVKLWFEAEK
jgi:SET domain-containing protein